MGSPVPSQVGICWLGWAAHLLGGSWEQLLLPGHVPGPTPGLGQRAGPEEVQHLPSHSRGWPDLGGRGVWQSSRRLEGERVRVGPTAAAAPRLLPPSDGYGTSRCTARP